MVSYKLDKFDRMFIAFVFVLVTLFNIGSFVFASEDWEEVNTTLLSDVAASTNSNYFTSSSGSNTRYFQLEVGYIYRVRVLQNLSGRRLVVGSSDQPAVNVPYDILTSSLLNAGDSYSFISNGSSYAFLAFSPSAQTTAITVERQKIEGYNSAISDLVDNVGLNNFWGVFEGGIDFVGVVVLVAFGIFLVALAIKKISKGKSDF